MGALCRLSHVASRLVIVSHDLECVFIKTVKTAGTSVEVLLSPHMGADAIVTPASEVPPEHADRNWRGLGSPLRDTWQALNGPPTSRRRRVRAAVARTKRREAYWPHMPAAAVRRRIGRRRWDRYFKFCVERNPWDKTISAYWWSRSRGRLIGFEDFVFAGGGGGGRSDWDRYSIDGEIAVDLVARYETLDSDMRHVWQVLGLPSVPELSRAKGRHRPEQDPTRISPKASHRIEEVFAREIACFGYECPHELRSADW